ncbi:hypothetical protein Rhe02_41950 [Rhizocola hellebori]|uniref:Uncharacterized protein n=1 Tax=Rhizocola hellebori TaxID=1392758 RepID=A0A8J3QAF2_9ACTN|nr:hypothetical protein [Rhizocola hellebori]GIH06128.1 hypothetical protein Rhe02_41950 [Rhizocola hellebori]
MTEQDIKRLVDSAAATVPAYPDNLNGVRKRAAKMRRRRTLAVTAALVLLVGAAVPVWISAMNRADSTSDTLTSSAQPMIIYPIALNIESGLEKLDPSWRIAQIRPNRTIVGYPLPDNDLRHEIFTLSQQGEIVSVGRRAMPEPKQGPLCNNSEEFVVFGDRSGNETRRVRLPEACELSGIIGADGDTVYLRRGRDDITVVDLITGQTRTLLTMHYPMSQTFAGGTIAVVEPVRASFTDGQQVDCTSDGWTIRTLNVTTGELRKLSHPGSPCDRVGGLSVSPDGTHVAFIQKHDDTAQAFVIDIATGQTVATRQIGGPIAPEIFGIAFADNKTAWVAWLPNDRPRQPPPRLADVVAFATLALG